MCGIAGYSGKGTKKMLITMLEAISHRGPDDRGIYVNEEIGLGHNRLSIIDLSSKGKQPMFNQQKTVCIIFNGEIYNYKEVKKELEENYKFNSKTDTEVILHAYEEWGVECVKKLNGMFSFVIYDVRKKILFGAVDRLGEKPLKYFHSGKLFVFASEIKSILSVLTSKPKIDNVAINDFLTLQYIPHPKTGFENIFKLPPAHYFIFRNGNLTVKRYWSLSFNEKYDVGVREWENLIINRLEKSVASRMYSDVPVGALLSGGVDSSLVVAFMARNSKKAIKTFSIGFDVPKYDETYYSNMVAKQYSTDHHVLQLKSKDLINNIDNIINYFDEPIADNSILPTFLVSKLVRKQVKVAITGDGGDENFGGYERYNIVAFSNYYKLIPKILRRNVIKNATNLLRRTTDSIFSDRLYRFNETFDQSFPRKYLQYSCFFTNDLKKNLFTENFLNSISKTDTFSLYGDLYNRRLDDLDNSYNFDINYYLPDDLLYKSDISSMANSLELRAPLLDHELFELSAKIPSNLKTSVFGKKLILKNALLKKGILPREVLFRKKQGFVAPIDSWFRKDLKSYIYKRIFSEAMFQSNIFEKGKIKSYVDLYFNSHAISANNIFALLSLSTWLNKYA